MELARILHPWHYDRNRKRFQSTCFRNYGDSISLIDIDCIRERVGESGVCPYISEYYEKASGEPVVYWTLDQEYLEQRYGASFQSSVSTSGDPCHVDLRGLSNRQAQRFYKERWTSSQIYVCIDNQPTLADSDQLFELMNNSTQ